MKKKPAKKAIGRPLTRVIERIPLSPEKLASIIARDKFSPVKKNTKTKNIIIALFVLAMASPALSAPYKRNQYGGWIDGDKDCQNTRQEILIKESLIPVRLGAKGCKVLSGKWLSYYNTKTYLNPSKLDIDHIVPLAEAHISGAEKWDRKLKRAFANDPLNLIAVDASSNRSKGKRDPNNWMPKNRDYWCSYLIRWNKIKTKYGLFMDKNESQFIFITLAAALGETKDTIEDGLEPYLLRCGFIENYIHIEPR